MIEKLSKLEKNQYYSLEYNLKTIINKIKYNYITKIDNKNIIELFKNYSTKIINLVIYNFQIDS